MKNLKKKNEIGITLIALVITVVILLILGTVVIVSLSGDNGILSNAVEAKIDTILSVVKENLLLEQIDRVEKEGDLTPEILLAENRVKRKVKQEDDGNYYLYYVIKPEAVEGMSGLGKGVLTELKDVFLIDDNLNIKYVASDGKEYGDNIVKKILKDETKIRFANKGFSEYISKISGAPEEEMKFEWMKNCTTLKITDIEVDSLEDLVFFPNLTSLTLGEYGAKIPQITSMDGVENCTNLNSITIIYGPDKDYSAVSLLSNLTYFHRFAGNDYENIMVALKECKNLKDFQVRNQKITDMSKISELNNLTLTSLDLSLNQITKIDGLKKMQNLGYLNLGNNLIQDLDGLENLTNLKTLYLNNNQIKDITPLSLNTSLFFLDLKGNPEIDGNRDNYIGDELESLNKIGEILNKGGTINLDSDKLNLFTNYERLDLNNLGLSTLDSLEGITKLKILNLQGNKLTFEDQKSQQIIKSMTNLESLDLSNNNITNIKEINNLNKLNILYLKGENNKINLKEIEDIISNLSMLTISTDSLKTILNCDANKITKLYIQRLWVNGNT